MSNEYFLKMKEIIKSFVYEFQNVETREDAEYFLKMITEANYSKHIRGKQLSKIISFIG